MQEKKGWNIFVIIMLLIIAIGTFIFFKNSYNQKFRNIIDSSSVPSVQSVPSVPSFPSIQTLPNFIASTNFNGAKLGYVFKNDINGIGYYKDKFSN